VETWVGERAEFELVATWDREKMFKVASVDKAMEMGINWWQQDPYLSDGKKAKAVADETKELKKRIKRLEEKVR
jgi:hypothetical protein